MPTGAGAPAVGGKKTRRDAALGRVTMSPCVQRGGVDACVVRERRVDGRRRAGRGHRAGPGARRVQRAGPGRVVRRPAEVGRDLCRPGEAVRGVARVRVAPARQRRARLLVRVHVRPARRPSPVPGAAGGDRHQRVARRAADRISVGPGRDERPRFRPPGAAAVVAQPRVLRHDLPRAERRARARRAGCARVDRPVEVRVSTQPRERRRAGRPPPHGLGDAGAGAVEPHRGRARSLARRHPRHGRPGRRPRRARDEGGGDERRPRRVDQAGAHGDRRIPRVAREPASVEEGAVRRRPRQLHLVHPPRPPHALHVGAGGDDDGARAGARPRRARPRGAAEPAASRRSSRSRLPPSTTGASTSP